MSIDKANDFGTAEDVPEDRRRTIDPETFAYGEFGISDELLAAPIPSEEKRAMLHDWERQLKMLGTTKSTVFSLDVRYAIGEID
jgi:hypothetical protein